MIPRAAFQAFAALVFLLFVFVAALILGGCSPKVADDHSDGVADIIRSGRLQYAQDPNTGYCFAYAWIDRGFGRTESGGPVVTWVPCDAQVERR